MRDVFAEVREHVPTVEAARLYGFEVNRSNFCRCPFHAERTPSLKFFPDGGRRCFGCGAGGDVVDFTSRLLNLDAQGAVRRLNQDFHLSLPLDRPREADRRRDVSAAHQVFQDWREQTLLMLTKAIRAGNEALQKPMETWTDTEALAVWWQAVLEYRYDVLAFGAMDEQMELFRNRKEVTALCSRILNDMPTKSEAS